MRRSTNGWLMMSEGWKATAEQINALPEDVRQWVHELEARCDPASDLRQRRIAEDRAVGAEATIERYKRAFRHTHEAQRIDGVMVDACGKCGLDIRDDFHECLEGMCG